VGGAGWEKLPRGGQAARQIARPSGSLDPPALHREERTPAPLPQPPTWLRKMLPDFLAGGTPKVPGPAIRMFPAFSPCEGRGWVVAGGAGFSSNPSRVTHPPGWV
jgi:hypothetical protein